MYKYALSIKHSRLIVDLRRANIQQVTALIDQTHKWLENEHYK